MLHVDPGTLRMSSSRRTSSLVRNHHARSSHTARFASAAIDPGAIRHMATNCFASTDANADGSMISDAARSGPDRPAGDAELGKPPSGHSGLLRRRSSEPAMPQAV